MFFFSSGLPARRWRRDVVVVDKRHRVGPCCGGFSGFRFFGYSVFRVFDFRLGSRLVGNVSGKSRTHYGPPARWRRKYSAWTPSTVSRPRRKMDPLLFRGPNCCGGKNVFAAPRHWNAAVEQRQQCGPDKTNVDNTHYGGAQVCRTATITIIAATAFSADPHAAARPCLRALCVSKISSSPRAHEHTCFSDCFAFRPMQVS